jgi:predicted DNA-binding transcriptional regulator AlpA
MEFEFTLKFTLVAGSPNMDQFVERLGAAGCNDALIGIGQTGRIALDFTREAESAKRAIVSALEQVRRAIPTAQLLEVAPDFVGLTEIAELAGVTRQNMRKLSIAHKDTFPIPMHEGSAALWHLSPVLQWLQEHAYPISQSLLDVAHIAMQINLAKEASQIEHSFQTEVLEFVA